MSKKEMNKLNRIKKNKVESQNHASQKKQSLRLEPPGNHTLKVESRKGRPSIDMTVYILREWDRGRERERKKRTKGIINYLSY